MATPVCRVCLIGNVKRFYIEENDMLQIYSKLTSTELNTVQRPRGVCYVCLSMLQKCCRFSEMVLRSERILTDLLDHGIVVSDDMPMPTMDLGVQSMLSVAPMQTLIIDGDDTVEHVDLTIEDEPHVGTESVSEDEHITEKGTVSNDFNQTVAITHNTTTNYSVPLFDKEPRAYKPEHLRSEDEFLKFDHTLDEDFVKVISNNDESKDMKPELSASEDKFNKFALTIDEDDKVITNNDESKDVKPELSASEDKFIKFEITIDEDFDKVVTNKDTTTDLVPTYTIETVKSTHFMEKNTDNHDSYTTVEQNKSPLPKHMRSYSRKIGPFVCKQCNESFTCYNNYERHIQTHPALRFTCHFCNKTFAQNGYLIIHMRIHTNVKPFSCKYCDKSFILSSNLTGHMRIHTGEKPYPCKYCNRHFRQSSQLKKHMKVYPEVNAMTCKYCTKSFNRKCMLLAHQKTHPEESLHACSLCDKSFATMRRLRDHRGTHIEMK